MDGQGPADEARGGAGSGGDGPPAWDDAEGVGRARLDDSARIPSAIIRLDEVVIGDPPEPVCSLIHPEPGAMTVLFGDGSSGKGTLAAWIVAQATVQGLKVLILDAEGHRNEWARRVTGFGGVTRRVVHWNHPIGVPVLDDYAGLFDLLVLDSAAYFTVGDDDMMGSSGATRLQAALAVTRTPALVIAHVSKGLETDKPYGSVFWHNTARVTLRLAEVDGRRTLKCFKATDIKGLRKGDAWDVEVMYDEDGLTPMTLDLVQPGLVFTSPLTRIVDEVLSDGEWHGILDFTLHGHSASGYRLLLDGDTTIMRGTRPSPTGGRPQVTWRRAP